MPSGVFPGEAPIFDIISDSRSPRSRLWSFAAAVALNTLLLGTLAISTQVIAARNAAARMLQILRGELVDFRLIAMMELPPRIPDPFAEKTPARTPPALPAADPRILDGLYPQVAQFVRENQTLETILTREIVRDIHSRVLTVETLNPGSSMRLSFEVDDQGRVQKRRILRSSKVPSIDRLFLELISLLESYQILAPMKGLQKVVATLAVEEEIAVRLEGEAVDDSAAEEVRKQLQNMLTLTRFALGNSDAAEMLDGVNLGTEGRTISMTKAFDKQPVIDFLLRYGPRGSAAPRASETVTPGRP